MGELRVSVTPILEGYLMCLQCLRIGSLYFLHCSWISFSMQKMLEGYEKGLPCKNMYIMRAVTFLLTHSFIRCSFVCCSFVHSFIWNYGLKPEPFSCSGDILWLNCTSGPCPFEFKRCGIKNTKLHVASLCSLMHW